MRLWLCLGMVLAASSTARAHTRSVSYSTLRLDESALRLVIKVAERDLSRAGIDLREWSDATKQRVSSTLVTQITLFSAEGRCQLEGFESASFTREDGWLRLGWRARCTGSVQGAEIKLFAQLADHVHLLRVLSEASSAQTYVLNKDARRVRFDRPSEVQSSFLALLRFGAEHILSGWDHVVFVFLLLIGVSRLWDLLAVITGFTLGHSLSLAALLFAWVEVNAPQVEVLIALSLAWLAVENFWLSERTNTRGLVWAVSLVLLGVAALSRDPLFLGVALFALSYFLLLSRSRRPARFRWWFALLFGLAHGLGFAGALLEQGEAIGASLRTLFSFNLGVEAGQLLIVACSWPLLWVIRERGWARPLVVLSSALALGLAGYFCVLRLAAVSA